MNVPPVVVRARELENIPFDFASHAGMPVEDPAASYGLKCATLSRAWSIELRAWSRRDEKTKVRKWESGKV
jgi:hypothetical protein